VRNWTKSARLPGGRHCRQSRSFLQWETSFAPLFLLLLTAASPVRTKEGLVVSAHPDASAAGAAMLRKGGTAIDALVATGYALSVVEPFSAGIGGGGFLLYYVAAEKKTYVLDYREVAPKKAHRDMFLRDGKVVPELSREGYFSVAVPGMVPGFEVAQKRFGKLALKDALAPSIDLAANGFRVSPRFFNASRFQLELLKKNPEAARVFLKKAEEPYQVGEMLVQKDLAAMLRALAKDGPRIFKDGWVAKAIAADSKRQGGLLELADFQSFEPKWREPLVGRYRGFEVLTMPPPSSGGTHLLQILGLLEIDRAKRGRSDDWENVDDLHVLIESMRLAYADRAEYMGDPAFVKVPVAGLLDRRYLERRYREIDPKKARASNTLKAGVVPKESPDTTNITIIDREGNVAVCTQTVNYGFGSGVVVPKTGILLNNEMDDFAAAPDAPNLFGLVGGEANSVQPGKIPLSSMTPTIVLKDGAVRLAVGAPGGSTIITTVLQAILHIVEHDMNVQQAIGHPRIHHQWLPDQLSLEPGALSASVRRALEKKGHQLDTKEAFYWGNATGIEVRADGWRFGAADVRGDGAPVSE
jgi:gamma-glutamyltranspeptidase/glutathione hydrolase